MSTTAAGGIARVQSAIGVRQIGWLALAAAGITAGLITYGAWVRVSASGLGCPNWPLCSGDIFPGHHKEALIESGHRFFAGLTLVLVFVLALAGYWRRREIPGAARLLGAAAVLIVVQAVLGGVTVLTHLPGSIRLVHLAVALTILATLSAAGWLVLSRDWRPAPAHRGTRAFPLVVLVAAAILVGGSIVATQTSFGCLDLPFCNGHATSTAKWLHSLHRVMGVVLFAGIGLTALELRRRGGTPLMWRILAVSGALVVAQMSVGAAAISLTLPGGLRILHVALATLTWWSLVSLWTVTLVWPKARPET